MWLGFHGRGPSSSFLAHPEAARQQGWEIDSWKEKISMKHSPTRRKHSKKGNQPFAREIENILPTHFKFKNWKYAVWHQAMCIFKQYILLIYIQATYHVYVMYNICTRMISSIFPPAGTDEKQCANREKKIWKKLSREYRSEMWKGENGRKRKPHKKRPTFRGCSSNWVSDSAFVIVLD